MNDYFITSWGGRVISGDSCQQESTTSGITEVCGDEGEKTEKVRISIYESVTHCLISDTDTELPLSF